MSSPPLYTAALVGRPNAGKSSLFNALLNRHYSIVSEEPGVTRDTLRMPLPLIQIPAKAQTSQPTSTARSPRDWLSLVDTAGIQQTNYQLKHSEAAILRATLSAHPSPLTISIARQIFATAHAADILIALFDLQALLPEDQSTLALLRSLNKPLLTVFNKSDQAATATLLQAEAHAIGAQAPLFVSARTGYNLQALKSALQQLTAKLCDQAATPLNPVPWERWDYTLTIIGKPNAGKSSLLNKLHERQTALVHAEAGTTRDLVQAVIPIGNEYIRVIDTAGLRRRTRKKERLETFSVQKAIHAINQGDLAILLVDATVVFSEQDKKIAATVIHAHKPCIIAINKWDLYLETVADASTSTTAWQQYLRRLEFLFPIISQFSVIKISAMTGLGTQTLLKLAHKLFQAHSKMLTTHHVNTLLSSAMKANPPTINSEGRRLKIYYGVQLSSAPPVIKVFINHTTLFKANYKRYLQHFIQSQAFCNGVPLLLLSEAKTPTNAPPSRKSPPRLSKRTKGNSAISASARSAKRPAAHSK